MTSADTEAMTALQELLDERQRYEGWISALEGRRATTPSHVYERVQADYSLRLERVTQRLSERAGQLASTIEDLSSRLESLRARESDRTDERQEAELRAAVGEYTPDEWERRRQEVDGDLATMATEREGLERELTELERIMALTRGETPVEPVQGGNGSSPEGEPRAREEAPEPAAAATKSEPSHAGTAQTLENFVADWPVAHMEASAASVVAAPQGDGVPDVPEVGGAVPSMGNPVGAAGADYGRAHGIGVRAAESGGAHPATHESDTRREGDKSLKCPECGAMNYATEWYCERCGGELSSF